MSGYILLVYHNETPVIAKMIGLFSCYENAQMYAKEKNFVWYEIKKYMPSERKKE